MEKGKLSGSGSGSGSGGSGSGSGKARRAQVANACMACRSAKLKCSGEHPSCARCTGRSLFCEYDTAEGMTKREQLRHDLTGRSEELERCMGVISHLQHASDQEAAESLARLRIGCSIEMEFRRIQQTHRSAASSQPGTSPGGTKSRQLVTDGEQDGDHSLVIHNQRLLGLLSPNTQQPEAQMEWSQSSSSRDGWLEPDGPHWEARNYDSIDPQILDQGGPSSQSSRQDPHQYQRRRDGGP